MLKSPIRKIGGFGKFVEYKNMKASEAWAKYGRDNGVENLSQLISRTDKYKAKAKNILGGMKVVYDKLRPPNDKKFKENS